MIVIFTKFAKAIGNCVKVVYTAFNYKEIGVENAKNIKP